MRIHLGGHLSWYDPQKRPWLDLSPAAGLVSLRDLLNVLGVPPGDVAVALINRRPAPLDQAVAADTDTVEFYPPLGGG